MRHQRGKGRDDRDRFALQNPALHANALLGELVAVYIRLIKYQILRRIKIRLTAVQAAVLEKFPRFDVAVGHDQFHLIVLVRTKYHMKLL